MITTLEVLRRDAGWTQAELATRARVARSTVIGIEMGHRPTGAILARLAEPLGTALNRHFEPASLTEPDLFTDPELAPLVNRVGQLLAWLPFNEPRAAVWTALTPPDMYSPDYLHDKWFFIKSALTDDNRQQMYANVGAEMRYILLFLVPSPDLITALTDFFCCQSDEVARRWCDELLACAWRIWTATNSEPPT